MTHVLDIMLVCALHVFVGMRVYGVCVRLGIILVDMCIGNVDTELSSGVLYSSGGLEFTLSNHKNFIIYVRIYFEGKKTCS